VPVETARVAAAAFPKGAVAIRLRDVFGEVFSDEQFVELFAVRGRPGVAPGLLALVSVLQFLEGLTDRQAALAVAGRIDWKYALGWELTDPGFDFSVLSQFRDRVIAGGAEMLMFETMVDHARAAGLLRAGGRVRTDSTQVLAVVRELNRVEMLIETVRVALEALAGVDSDWTRSVIDVVGEADWWRRYSVRAESFRLPTGPGKRAALIQTVGIDGFALLQVAYDPAAPGWVREVPAVQILRRVWVQQFEITYPTSKNNSGDRGGGPGVFPAGGVVSLRDKENLPPAGVRIVSPHEGPGPKRELG
jgi:transposase